MALFSPLPRGQCLGVAMGSPEAVFGLAARCNDCNYQQSSDSPSPQKTDGWPTGGPKLASGKNQDVNSGRPQRDFWCKNWQISPGFLPAGNHPDSALRARLHA